MKKYWTVAIKQIPEKDTLPKNLFWHLPHRGLRLGREITHLLPALVIAVLHNEWSHKKWHSLILIKLCARVTHFSWFRPIWKCARYSQYRILPQQTQFSARDYQIACVKLATDHQPFGQIFSRNRSIYLSYISLIDSARCDMLTW